MAKSLKDIINNVAEGIETVLGGNKPTSLAGYVGNGGSQSRLEKVGFTSRSEHLIKNEWSREMPYSKMLVESEYDVQKEFDV